MGPITHTVVSGGLGAAIWATTDTPEAIPVAIFTGVFTDSDHILDKFDSRDGRYRAHMIRLFHAWEYAIIGLAAVLLVWYHPIFLAAVVGYMSHVFIDQFGNQSHPLAYFMTYRVKKRFKRRVLTPHLFKPSYKILRAPLPLWAKLEPRWYRIYLRIRTGEPW